MAGKILFTKEQIETMVRLYEDEKLTTREIGELYNVDHKTVARHLRLQGVSLRPRWESKRNLSNCIDVDEVVDLYVNKKMSAQSIAEKLRISKRSVLNLLRKNGVKIRSKSDYKLDHTVWSGYAVEQGQLRARKAVEAFLGIKLKPHNVVHHIDGNKLNDDPRNLLPCEDESYHKMLEARIRWRKYSIRKYGRPDVRICRRCRKPDLMSNMVKIPGKYNNQYVHERCSSRVER